MSDSSPPLRPFARGHIRVQTASEAGAFDRRAIDEVGVPEVVLMENAGRSAALLARRLLLAPFRGTPTADGAAKGVGGPPSRPVPIVALVGSGNNGGDALVVLRSFAAWGYQTRAVVVADRAADDPLLHGWPVDIVDDRDLADTELQALLGTAALVVDGILGTGARGAPRPRQARVIEALNDSQGPVMALDVPSGADASSGGVSGAIVDADLTVSFGAPKIGALLHPARARVGRHVTVEIGFPPITDADASAFAVTPSWVARRLPRRGTDTHKNEVGRVVVVGGGAGMAGAAILAGRAAFRAGAGLVQIATAAENRAAVLGAVPEAIVLAWNDSEALRRALEEADAVVAGPGLGTGTEAAHVLRVALAEGAAPLVLDADGLNLVADGAVDLPGGRPMLMTPHPGEMRRLLDAREGAGAPPSDGGGTSSLDLARAAATRMHCTVLYKGAPSVVAASEGPMAIDTQSTSDLAVAGMGDTLAGVCGAVAAQGLDVADAGAVGLYLSGRAATLARRGPGLTPSDVVESVPAAIAELVGLGDDLVRGFGGGSTELDLPFVLFDADPAR
ncbi:MAG: NAD(P)H-hydrate dehydratase [Gemmatimonadetes bacterium]|nr:NAD(P)H-hydrate dehydratase [Gemmatimonadota bacterium]